MKQDPAELLRSIDAPVKKAIEDLALYAKTHPQALAVRVALEGILGHLIHAARQLNTTEGDETQSISLLEELATLFPASRFLPSFVEDLHRTGRPCGSPQTRRGWASAGARQP